MSKTLDETKVRKLADLADRLAVGAEHLYKYPSECKEAGIPRRALRGPILDAANRLNSRLVRETEERWNSKLAGTETPAPMPKENAMKITKSQAVALLEGCDVEVEEGSSSTDLMSQLEALNVDELENAFEGDEEMGDLLDNVLEAIGTGDLTISSPRKAAKKAAKKTAKKKTAKKATPQTEDKAGGSGKKKTKKKTTKKKAAPKAGNNPGRARIMVFDKYPVTGVCRWMGANGFSTKLAKAVLAELGVECSPTTISIQVKAGEHGDTKRGEPAQLTKAEAGKLKAALKKAKAEAEGE